MYAKIFTQIFDSSIREHPESRFTFMDLLILADIDGVVDMTHEALAARTNRPLAIIKATIAALEQPDPRSRTQAHQGRRIVRLDDHRDWGWIIVNYDRFRKTASEEQRREKTRERVRRFKQNHKEKRTGNARVTQGNASNAMQRQRQKERQKERQKDKKKEKAATPFDVLRQPNGKAIVVPEIAETCSATLKPPTQKRALTDQWCAEYQTKFGYKYVFAGAKDGQAADRILATGIAIEEIVGLAKAAWNNPAGFNCKFAASMSGFVSRFNDIRHELIKLTPAGSNI